MQKYKKIGYHTRVNTCKSKNLININIKYTEYQVVACPIYHTILIKQSHNN